MAANGSNDDSHAGSGDTIERPVALEEPGSPSVPYVFISYSHDSQAHRARVANLANRLRREGIPAWLDAFEDPPAEGWPRWMRDQLSKAVIVLVVCTPQYRQRFEGRTEGDVGRGVNWEGFLTEQAIYNDDSRNRRFIPVLFDNTTNDIPDVLRSTTHYVLPDGYESLYRRLTSQPRVRPVPVGTIKSLPNPRTDDELNDLREQRKALLIAGQATNEIDNLILIRRRQIRDTDNVGPGMRLADNRFEIIDQIGRGGFATVWKAYDGAKGRLVAVKVLHQQHGDDSSRRERFFRGARQMAMLQHSGIVQVVEPEGRLDEIPYFVMEYVPGGDLHDNAAGAPWKHGRVIETLVRVGEALAIAHERGVIHRDVKPANILLNAERLPKLTDFDLVRAVDTTGGTRTGAIGTFLYAAPETMEDGSRVDHRADIFSLGMVGTYLLYGKNLPTRAWRDTRAFLSQLRCPPALVNVLSRASAWEKEDRQTDVATLIDELRDCSHTLDAQSIGLSLNHQLGSTSFVGRTSELRRLNEARTSPHRGLTFVHVVGRIGSGRTRLLRETVETSLQEGDLVVWAEPDVVEAPVAYFAIRSTILRLLDATEPQLASQADALESSQPLISVGLRELLKPEALRGSNGRSRAGAVARALAHAVRVSLSSHRKTQATLIIDDLDLCDGLTNEVLVELRAFAQELRATILTTSVSPPYGSHEQEILQLTCLNQDEANTLVERSPELAKRQGEIPSRCPLYIQQIRSMMSEGLLKPHTQLPRSDAAAFTDRFAALAPDEKRALTALSVLGRRCTMSTLGQLMTAPKLEEILNRLASAGMASLHQGVIEVAHPLIRSMAIAAMPSETRRALYLRALDVDERAASNIDVRASYLYYCGDSEAALLVLEKAGDGAVERGDLRASALYYRRALDVARRQYLELGEDAFESLIFIFSHKLGTQLRAIGDLAASEGVLREALEMNPARLLKVRILVPLAQAIGARGQARPAYRMLGEAVEIAISCDDYEGQASAHVALGELREVEGNIGSAFSSYTQALESFQRAGRSMEAAKTGAQLLTLLQAGTDWTEFVKVARGLAEEVGSPYLQAKVSAEFARLCYESGRTSEAEDAWANAMQWAVKAGDSASLRRYEDARGSAHRGV